MVNTRKALEKLWKGTCTVWIKKGSANPVTKRTEFVDEMLYENQPCKLSVKRVVVTSPNGSTAVVTQKTELFLAPEIIIPAGSKVTVTQNGVTESYERSGKSALYTNHQQVPLELVEERA